MAIVNQFPGGGSGGGGSVPSGYAPFVFREITPKNQTTSSANASLCLTEERIGFNGRVTSSTSKAYFQVLRNVIFKKQSSSTGSDTFTLVPNQAYSLSLSAPSNATKLRLYENDTASGTVAFESYSTSTNYFYYE